MAAKKAKNETNRNDVSYFCWDTHVLEIAKDAANIQHRLR
jgi:hypothetical protein